jgi:TatD DNase family protein
MFDTHLHLVNEGYEDLDKVINDAKEVGVLYLILGGCSKNDNISSIELCKNYDNLFLTLGYHPSEVNDFMDNDLLLLEKQIVDNKDKVVGIGEIGLDYHYGKDNRSLQIELFQKQILLAKKYGLPIVIHTRDAISETYDILKDSGVKGVIHCFSGSLEMAKKFIELGFYLGIGGVVSFSNSKLGDVVREIDLSHIVLETDSPYLSPFRGVKNEPKNIKVIAERIAFLKGVSVSDVEKITSANAISLFDLNKKI